MKTYGGGCHCGKVRYDVKTDLSKVFECNCSHCSKKAFLLTFVTPEQFTLRQGTDALTEYQFNKKKIHHVFCSACGVESFASGSGPDGKTMYSINVRCLDGVDPAALTITPLDGKRY